MNPRFNNRPPFWISAVLTLFFTVTWPFVHLVVFPQHIVPLTYVIPLLVGVWMRDKRLVVFMATVFFLSVIGKSFLGPQNGPFDQEALNALARSINILIATLVVIALINLRESLENSNQELKDLNAELEVANEELVTREEEIASQNEELKQQSEDLEQQAEELRRNSEILGEVGDQLQRQKQMLEVVFASSGSSEAEFLSALCSESLKFLGHDVHATAIISAHGDSLESKCYAGTFGAADYFNSIPSMKTISRIVLEQRRIAAIEDLQLRPDLIVPSTINIPTRAVLASPIFEGDEITAVLEFYSSTPRKWSEQDFELAGWLSNQCGIALAFLHTNQKLKSKEQELQDSLTELREALRAKDNFLAVLSHELRTPLNPALLGTILLLRDEKLTAEQHKTAEMIRRNIELEARLIDDLLDLTRIANGKLTVNMLHLNAVELLRQAISICEAEALEKGVQLRAYIADESAPVTADAARLQQVYWNVLKNAVKFTPPGGVITVESRTEFSMFNVHIIDTGIGISPDMLPRIFNAFEQGSSVVTRRHGGLGLGLSICKGILDTHDGEIFVSSEGDGKGSRFTIRIPIAKESRPNDVLEIRTAVREEQPTAGSILLVEDHDDTAEFLTHILRNNGHTVTRASSVADALNLHAKLGPSLDLIISDIGLPDGDGSDMLIEMTKVGKVNAIALTGFGSELDVERCYTAGFALHLTKPINVDKLEEAVSKILGTREANLSKTIETNDNLQS